MHHIFLGTLLFAMPAMAQRNLDPVVMTGKDLPTLIGKAPPSVVAFRYRNDAWQQVPVQIDERAMVSIAQIRQRSNSTPSYLVYTDANTFTGADKDPKFDANDELCFMATDTGDPAGFGQPVGVVANSRVDVLVTDPLSGNTRFLYLFEARSGSGLRPGAGKDYVRYNFKLLSGNYKTTYKLGGSSTGKPHNPEDSRVTTANYSLHFAGRWICDETKITAGTSTNKATGVDILDRHKFQFVPGICGRTTDTFSAGGGAHIAHIDGPVRAIRSVVGANSGGMTQRDWICYRGRMDMVSHLRVHAIRGTWFFVDYSAQAVGMTYRDNNNQTGVLIDGKPDQVKTGRIFWQAVTGKQGSMSLSFVIDTDIPANRITWGSFYDDNLKPSWNQCTGDAIAYGAAGPTTGGMPNTDPLRGTANTFIATTVFTYEAPGMTAKEAVQRSNQAHNPLRAVVLPAALSFGSACKGKRGTPDLQTAGAAIPGGSVLLRANGLANNAQGILVIGLSNIRWSAAGVDLPFDMKDSGMPGCLLLASADFLTLLTAKGNVMNHTVKVPPQSGLRGLRVFGQYFSEDKGSNRAGLVLSNGLRVTIGG